MVTQIAAEIPIFMEEVGVHLQLWSRQVCAHMYGPLRYPLHTDLSRHDLTYRDTQCYTLSAHRFFRTNSYPMGNLANVAPAVSLSQNLFAVPNLSLLDLSIIFKIDLDAKLNLLPPGQSASLLATVTSTISFSLGHLTTVASTKLVLYLFLWATWQLWLPLKLFREIDVKM